MNKKGLEIAKFILKLLGAGVIISTAIIFPNLALVGEDFVKRKSDFDRRRTKKTLWDLEKRKMIVRVERKNGTFFKLTGKGKMRLSEIKIKELKIKKLKKWNGWWWIVIFDIPENMKNIRERLRKILKDLGFYQLQKSVFVFPYQCQKEIDFIKATYHINTYVDLILAKSLGKKEKIVRRFFQL
ncbi:MAG: CRISPR-associated endonuclease Cas2 [Patescibacteria group bacterium]